MENDKIHVYTDSPGCLRIEAILLGFFSCIGLIQIGLHPAPGIIIGLFVVFIYYFIHQWKYGFYFITLISVVLWGTAGYFIAQYLHGDLVWRLCSAFFLGLIALFSHLRKRDFDRNVTIH